MKERVCEELSRLERELDVRLLLAVESGSRAWGFASPDSDYDVRFLYVHQHSWYLRVFEARDVIEAMLPGDLDLSGWELRKALRLFSKCNLGLNEWLGSPIIYSQVPQFTAQLRELLPRYFNPIAAMHHYRSMAEVALQEGSGESGGELHIGIKKLFYVLRPLLACRWIASMLTQPPTQFADLMAPEWVSAQEKAWITALLAQKADAAEAQQVQLAASRWQALRAELDRYKDAASRLPAPTLADSSVLDDLLRRWVQP